MCMLRCKGRWTERIYGKHQLICRIRRVNFWPFGKKVPFSFRKWKTILNKMFFFFGSPKVIQNVCHIQDFSTFNMEMTMALI